MKRLAAVVGTLAVVSSAVVMAWPGVTPVQGAPGDKWFVCKYVTTPGEGEQLQTGQNPISVAEEAIPISPVFPGAEFADQQGRSIVLVQDTGQPEPDAGDCPPPQGGTTTTTSPTTTTTEAPTTVATTTTTIPTPPPTFTTTTSSEPSSTSSSTTTSTPTTSGPSTSTTSSTTPGLTVDFLTPICDGDVPYLGYSASFDDATRVSSITFVNPDGDDFVYTDLPLAGRVLWPGAVVGPDGEPLDWPGWTEVAPDEWVEGDEFDWVRPSVVVILEINPSAIAEIGYPPSTPQCLTNPPQVPPPGVSTTTVPGSPPPPPAPPSALPPTR